VITVIQKGKSMKKAFEFVANGSFPVAHRRPFYLAVLLLLKAMQSVVTLVRPFANLLPEWFPAERVLSLSLVLIFCFLIGVAFRTLAGRALRERIETMFFDRMPGYALLRSLTQRLAGESDGSEWKPALAEIEDALVPAFIIEGWRTAALRFVPSGATPFAGAVYARPRSCPSWTFLYPGAQVCLPLESVPNLSPPCR
jgi:hypothetical protein